MKKLSLIISLLIALALLPACATATTVTPTAFAETSPTAKPTSIPPTAMVEPSPTVDPNMPEGATGKDANGNWINEKNEIWNPELNAWMRSLIVNDQGISVSLVTPKLQYHFYVSDAVAGASEVDSISYHGSAGNSPGYENAILAKMQSVLEKSPDWNNYVNTLGTEISIPFTTSEGPQIMTVGNNTITKIEVDIIDKPIGDGFHTWYNSTNTKIQSRMFSDKDGNVHVWHVIGKPINQCTPQELAELLLFGPVSILDNPDETHLGESTLLLVYSRMAGAPRSGEAPFLDFGPPQ